MNPFPTLLKIFPFLSVLGFIMGGCRLSIGPYPLLPAFFLIPIYYWVLFRPDWLPIWSLLGVGLFYDSLMGYPLGLTSFLLILSAIVGQYVRPLLNPYNFFLTWMGFGLYSLGYVIAYTLLISGGFPFFVAWTYTLIVYPLMAWGLNLLHAWLQSYD